MGICEKTSASKLYIYNISKKNLSKVKYVKLYRMTWMTEMFLSKAKITVKCVLKLLGTFNAIFEVH